MNTLSASPKFLFKGVRDLSTRMLEAMEKKYPNHIAKVYTFAAKGPVGEAMFEPVNTYVQTLGSKTFDETSKFYNAATEMIQLLAGNGNQIVVERLIPDDAGNPANAVVYIDVIEDTLDVYKRNSDGSIKKDADGNPVKDGDKTTSGYRFKWVAKHVDNLDNVGIETGFLTNANGDSSTMYPIFITEAKAQGEEYNNYGFSISLLREGEYNEDIVKKSKVLPYAISLFNNVDGSDNKLTNTSNATRTLVSLNNKVKHPVTNSTFGVNKRVQSEYYNTNPKYPYRYPDFERVEVLQNYLSQVLDMFIEKELPFVNELVETETGPVESHIWYDFISTNENKIKTEEKYLLDITTGMSTKGVEYTAVRHDKTVVTLPDNVKEVLLTKNTPIYMQGGKDGTVTWEKFQEAVRKVVKNYSDPYAAEVDMAVSPETVMYDLGFDLPTKLELIPFIGLRKDTVLALSTYIHDMKEMTDEEQLAIAKSLVSRLKMFPESEEYGTGVMRAFIVMGYGDLEDDSSEKHTPLLYDIADKLSKYMNGDRWNSSYRFGSETKNQIKHFDVTTIRPKRLPEPFKEVLWRNQLIFPDTADRETKFFAAYQTVVSDDTSVANSIDTLFAISRLIRVAFQSWVHFTNSKKPDAVFREDIIRWINERVNAEYFDSQFRVEVNVVFTELDHQLGYTWNIVYDLYGQVGKTVASGTINVRRLSEYVAG